jgi:shikimate kinase
MKKNLIFLTGFMASGKSTIGPILANTLGWEFYDLDKVIEEKIGKTINKIFEVEGEVFFRKLETKTLKELSILQNHIIALGGGTVASNENLEIIKNSGYLIYLETSPDEAYRRLRFKRDRPALLFDGIDEPTKDDFIKKINSLLEKRLSYYNQADLKINTDNLRLGDTVDKLESVIKRELYDKKNNC